MKRGDLIKIVRSFDDIFFEVAREVNVCRVLFYKLQCSAGLN